MGGGTLVNRPGAGQGREPARRRIASRSRALLIAPLLAALAAPAAIPAARPASKPPAAATDNVATVGGIGISGTELDQRTTQALAEYQSHSSADVPAELKPVVKRQILERLIQHQLLTLEAKRLGMTATDAEAEDVLRRDPFFNEGGTFNEAKFQAVKGGNSAQYRAALEQARTAVSIRKLTDQALARAGVDDRAMRAKAMRELQRASFDYLALRRNDFSEPGAEPRELEVLDYYRTHAADLKRPDRAELSILWVQQELSDSTTASSQRLAAWEADQRRRADSVLAAARAGTRLEDIGRQFGGLKTRVVALPGNFPSYWRGDARQSQAVFAAAPGTILPAIVPSNPGWLVVRVDAVERAHPARLSEAAREIRAILRQQRIAHREERGVSPLARVYHKESASTSGNSPVRDRLYTASAIRFLCSNSPMPRLSVLVFLFNRLGKRLLTGQFKRFLGVGRGLQDYIHQRQLVAAKFPSYDNSRMR